MDEQRIPTNLRCLLILEILGRSEMPLTPTEINKEIGLPKQTVHRLCTTLEKEGFLIKEPNSNRLRPSRRLRLMGSGILHASRFHVMRHQVLEEVAAQVRETVNFVVPEDTGMHYLDRVETDWPFRVQLPVGTNVPFHCTASGKTFMASLPRGVLARFVSSLKLEQLTEKTLVDPDDLLEELKKTKKRGYAVDNEEFVKGMVAVAVPIHDVQGRYVASLAFHGPEQRIKLEEAVTRKDLLIEGAEKLSRTLFQ